MNPEREASPKSPDTGTRSSFFRRHRRKLLAVLLWLVLLGGYQLYAWRTGGSPPEAVRGFAHFLAAGMLGPLVYVALYAVRPLVLFPASLLAVAAGFAFGPVAGIALTVVGSNASASVAYLVGRYLGRGVLDPANSGQTDGTIHRYAERIRDNGFEAVLTLQFVYLPFDLVNYLAGFLRVGWGRFALATFLGSLPGVVAFVLLGSSVAMDLNTGAMSLDSRFLLASAITFTASIGISRIIKQRERKKEGDDGSRTDA